MAQPEAIREWAKEQIALYEKDDLVSMHRDFYIDYEKKKKDWKRYVEEINSFLEREHPQNDILSRR